MKLASSKMRSICIGLVLSGSASAFLSPQRRISPVVKSSRSVSSSFSRLSISLDDPWADVSTFLTKEGEVVNVNAGALAKQISAIEWTRLLAPGPGVAQVEEVIKSLLQAYLGLPLYQEVALVVLPLMAITATVLYSLSLPLENFRNGYEPYGRGDYDPLQARVYYNKYALLVIQRSLQLLRLSSGFISNILWDKYILRDEEINRPQRARELLELIQKLGPTAIKVGQALSVRPDLIPSEYAQALSSLQDRVPPFEGDLARSILEQELGPPKFGQLKEINLDRTPVASASIGQVYRGRIGDREVAVKVQRPNALAEIALDLFIVREFAPYYQKLTKSATDFQSLANEWGRGFIKELDYRTEAANTMKFNQEMQKRNLNSVTAPVVLPEFSTDRILITEWVNGQRIDLSREDDVPRLCSVALNAYLVMLLELQSLHCDPHPGNLLRTEDGRLCILDFGMTLETDPTLQYSLLEFVAHLTSEDYDRVPEDLVKLGFLRADRLETVRASGFLEPLTYILKQAGEGGGAKKVRERIFQEFREKYPGLDDEDLRVQMRADMKKRIEETRKRESAVSGITMEVEELQRRNRDAFRIPEWFVYTSRAFLTLEGVSLQADEDFSIVKSCFPYVAKRLVGDDSPRAQKALKDLLYGAGNSLDPERLTDLADGFAQYTTTSKIVDQSLSGTGAGDEIMDASEFIERRGSAKPQRSSVGDTEAAITLAKDSADILLAEDGNLVQNVLVEESALAASANVKDVLMDALVEGPRRFRDSLPLGLGNALPKLPLEDEVKPFLKKTQNEENAQNLVGKISSVLPQPPQLSIDPIQSGKSVDGGLSPEPRQSEVLQAIGDIDPEQAALVAKELRENIPRYAPLVGKLGGKFASSLLKTASNNIETTLDELEGGNDIVKTTAKNIASLATSGAEAISGTSSNSSNRNRQGE